MNAIVSKGKVIFSMLGETYSELLDDKVFKMTAALSYYTLLSLAPLLMIAIAIAGFIFGEEAARGEIVRQIDDLIGKSGAEAVQAIIQNAAAPTTGILATVISIVVIVLGSLGAFLEVKESLNIIWGVELKPGRPIMNLVKTRVGAFSMVLMIGFILMVSLFITAMLEALGNYLTSSFPALLPVLQIMNFVVSFMIITVLFALMFKYLPDVIIEWKYVWLGAGITSLLFSVGKYLIGLYLGNSTFSSTFGAAGSLVVLMVWLNYSSLILYFGAEFTQIYRKRFSATPLLADSDGVIIPKVSELVKDRIKDNKKIKE